jgi:YHS domain-containing protein
MIASFCLLTCTAIWPPTRGLAQSGDASKQPELKGFDPAAYLLQGKAVRGAPEHSVTYQGRLYYLSSEEARKKFEEDPEKHLPRLGGLCTTALGGPYSNRFDGDPEVFDVHEGRVYLFSSERARRSYQRDPKHYIVPAESRFAKPALEGFCPVTYQRLQQALKGNEQFSAYYGKWIYHLLDEQALADFRKDPKRYLPMYGGNCAMTMAEQGKPLPGDPEVFLVSVEHETFFFFNKDYKQKFMSNPGIFREQANENWKDLQAEP